MIAFLKAILRICWRSSRGRVEKLAFGGLDILCGSDVMISSLKRWSCEVWMGGIYDWCVVNCRVGDCEEWLLFREYFENTMCDAKVVIVFLGSGEHWDEMVMDIFLDMRYCDI